jgi:hypothetical protein
LGQSYQKWLFSWYSVANTTILRAPDPDPTDDNFPDYMTMVVWAAIIVGVVLALVGAT